MVVENLLEHLLSRASAQDKVVRHRSCLLLQQLLYALPKGFCIAEDLADSLSRELIARLCDKFPPARAAAARGSLRLATADEVRPNVTNSAHKERQLGSEH